MPPRRELTAFRLAAVLVLIGCRAAVAPAPQLVAEPFPEPLARIATAVAAPGVVAAVYRNGALTEVFASGTATCDRQGVIDPRAGYEIGSISKHVTAIAVLQLRDRGLLHLDSTASKYVTGVPESWRAVTLRQLLAHTSGIPDYEEVIGYDIYERSPSPQEVFAIVSNKPLDFAPGTNWNYSNTGYFLASLVIERVSGESYHDYVRNHVFRQLGLTNSYVSGFGGPGTRVAQGCKPAAEQGQLLPVLPITEASTLGAGSIVSTLQDWAKWDAALDGNSLLTDSSMRELKTSQRLPSGEATDYGYGLFIENFRGHRREAHTGQTRGFSASYLRFPEQNVSILVLANAYGARLGALSRALTFRALPQLSYHSWPAAPDPDTARTRLIRRALRQAILAEAPFDLLDPEMAGYPINPRFAAERASVSDVVAGADRFEYLRSEPAPGDYVRHLYRVAAGARVVYFTFGWRNGRLYRMRWENE